MITYTNMGHSRAGYVIRVASKDYIDQSAAQRSNSGRFTNKLFQVINICNI